MFQDTPLHMAVQDGNLDNVRCFLDHGADPNLTAYHGVSKITTDHHISVAVLEPLVIT